MVAQVDWIGPPLASENAPRRADLIVRAWTRREEGAEQGDSLAKSFRLRIGEISTLFLCGLRVAYSWTAKPRGWYNVRRGSSGPGTGFAIVAVGSIRISGR